MLYFLPLLVGLSFSLVLDAVADDGQHFAIEVVDESTGRGVPLVELETINHIRFVTDSMGMAAIAEPDLVGRTVYFTVRSHGYEYPKDGFGFRGEALKVKPGGKATLRIKRINLAERLYRATGSGIYRDTMLLGGKASIDNPLVNGDVFGCDSVMTAEYHRKIHWFWGDTSRPHYPLGGNFHVTGATSLRPTDGGLDPSVGVNFSYLVGTDGGVRSTAKMPGEGPTWISALTVLKDKDGRERMYAGYVKIRNQLESYEWGFVTWNDEKQRFEKVSSFDKKPPIFLEPQTHSFPRREKDGTEFIYFTNPLPLTRVKADPSAFVDPKSYEGFTCLKTGTQPEDMQLDRDAEGRLRYSWKADTPPLTQKDQAMFIKADAMKPDEALIALQDVATGREVVAHNGSVYWNDYRKRWVLICTELNGTSSFLGEIWYAEGDQPTGPWVYARKIITHDKYTFYNPKHHPFFDQDGGRTIFIEGTYTHTFSGNPQPTLRYDYNQIMYRLDLAHSELNLPVAFYDIGHSPDSPPFASKRSDRSVAFFAMERPGTNTFSVVWDGTSLQVESQSADTATVLFHALPANTKTPPATTTPLYEFIHRESGHRVYSVNPAWDQANYRRSREPICRVWNSKSTILIDHP